MNHVREIMKIHMQIALCFLIVGFVVQSIIQSTLNLEQYFVASKMVTINLTMHDLWNIFFNNILLFILISLTPIANSILFAVQFFMLGSLLKTAQLLSLDQQLTLLFRHTCFEILALFIAIYISYYLLLAILKYIKDIISLKDIKFIALKITYYYCIIIACTFLGALLEASVHAQF